MSKVIEFGPEAREKMINGIDKLADAVTATLGPNGRNVVIANGGIPQSTKDGVTVAKSITLEDPIEELGVQLVKQAAIKTADNAGDGTTTSTLLAREMAKQGLKYLNHGENAVEIKRSIDKAVKEVVEHLRLEIKEDISSEEQLKQIATISANNDPEVGELIADVGKLLKLKEHTSTYGRWRSKESIGRRTLQKYIVSNFITFGAAEPFCVAEEISILSRIRWYKVEIEYLFIKEKRDWVLLRSSIK